MTAGFIVNPLSGKNNAKGRELAAKLGGNDAVDTCILSDFSELEGSLRRFAERGVEDLFISSGDGTVQEIQTVLGERSPFERLPRLCLLPHGTTNLTASDLGFTVKSLDRQAEFLTSRSARSETRSLKQRSTLRIANPRDGKVRHGMFLGSGAIWRATVFCQQDVHRMTGLKGDWATFATLATSVVKAMFLPANPNDPDRIDRPYRMRVTADGKIRAEGDQLLFLASTLDRLILATRPYWGGKTAAIRATLFPYPSPSIVRWLLPMMYAGESRKFPDGSTSFCSEQMEIETDCPFVLDGEFFDPPENAALRIEKGVDLTYICG